MYKVVHCQRCGRVLKNPQSIIEGIGSTCRKKLGFVGNKQFLLFSDIKVNDKVNNKSNHNGM